MAFPDWSDRLSLEKGGTIVETGVRLGESEPSKGSYWSGYEYDGKYYISLNDEYETVWETPYDVLQKHCL